MIAIDMPMPKNCTECPCRWKTDTDNICVVWSGEGARILKQKDAARPDWCPLIDITNDNEGGTHDE